MIKKEIVDSYRDLVRELANETIDGRIKSIDETVRLFEGRISTQEQITDDISRKLNVETIALNIADFAKRIDKLEDEIAVAVQKVEERTKEFFKTIEDETLGMLEHRVDDIENHLGI